jgi:hypothetical protein
MITKPNAHRFSWVAVNKDGEYYSAQEIEVWTKNIAEAKVYKGSISNAKRWARSISGAVVILEVESVLRSSAKVTAPAMGAMKLRLRD